MTTHTIRWARALRVGVLATALAGALLVAVPAVEAAPPTCNETLTGGSFPRLVVGAGDVCILEGVSVGNAGIRVLPGGSLITNDSEVAGNVHSRGALTVRLIDTNVGHNIMVMNTQGAVVIGSEGCRVDPSTGNNLMVKKSQGTVAICFMTIDNNLHVTSARRNVGIFSNSVGNNLQVRDNSGPFVRLRDNIVDVNIQVFANNSQARLFRNAAGNQMMCRNNAPAPQGEDNTGTLVAQCAGLG